MITPIQKIYLRGSDNSIYIKREDLLPFSFGGNKYRIAEEYYEDMLKQKKNCIIGYGNPRSNLCRILSNLSLMRGIPCYIVSPADDDGTRINTNNSILTAICNATIVPCSKQNVSETVSRVINSCKEKGLDPYYINGNIYGKGNEYIPVKAYYKVYKEICDQFSDTKLDYIFLATGTGMTLAGLLVGKEEMQRSEEIIGISVARNKESAVAATSNYYKAFTKKDPQTINIDDSYVNGGYGKTNYEEIATIRNLYCTNGVLLDPVYTGKAFWGMKNYLVKHSIHNSNVLFVHTGGTPLSFDLLKETDWDNSFRKLELSQNDKEQLIAFLKENSNQFATPLDKVTNINEYSEKILSKGYAFAYFKANKMLGVVCGYANDVMQKNAFESVLVISQQVRGSGVAGALFELQYEFCKSQGMKYIQFSTDQRNIAAKKFYEKQMVEIDMERTNSNLVYYRMKV